MTNNTINKIPALFLYIISIISYYTIINKNSNFFAIKNILGTAFFCITTGIFIYTNMKNNKFHKIAAYILHIISMIYCYMIGPKFSNPFAVKDVLGGVCAGITTSILIYTNMKNNKFHKIAAYILYIISMIYCYMIGPKFSNPFAVKYIILGGACVGIASGIFMYKNVVKHINNKNDNKNNK